jgi:hypothetical protein
MMEFREWAARWGVPMAAVVEWENEMQGVTPGRIPDVTVGKSEAWAQVQIRLEAAQKGVAIFRNNVGVLKDKTGRPVRYGLGNDSPALNEVLKSGDLIGVRPVLILPQHVGTTVGQFVSREAKPPGWVYTATPRERAQMAWANLIRSKGGDASFATGPGTL